MTLARTPIDYVREADRIPAAETPFRLDPVDLTPILGTWWNTNRRTTGILRAELTDRDGQVWMHAWTVDPASAEPNDWGEVAVRRLYADGPRSNVICAYTATFDLGHARIQIEANQNPGLTVLATFTTFTDGSGRQSYLSREFYHRRGGG